MKKSDSGKQGDNQHLPAAEEQSRSDDFTTHPPENRGNEGVQPSSRLRQLRREGQLRDISQQEGTSATQKETTDASKQEDTGDKIIERIKWCLQRELSNSSNLQKIGFHGFNGKIVFDIGTRDGRYIPVFEALGAKKVYGIDPDKGAINTAIEKGLLRKEHAIPKTLENIPQELEGIADVGAVFNLNPDLARNEGFIGSLKDKLPPHAQVIMTVVETETYHNVLPLMKKHFDVRSHQLWRDVPHNAHSYLIIADQKPTIEAIAQKLIDRLPRFTNEAMEYLNNVSYPTFISPKQFYGSKKMFSAGALGPEQRQKWLQEVLDHMKEPHHAQQVAKWLQVIDDELGG